jgi:hypothetical protein
VERPSGLIKRGGGALALKVRLQDGLIKVEFFLQERISVIDLNCNRILKLGIFSNFVLKGKV